MKGTTARMSNNSSLVANSNLPTLLPKPPSSIKPHESLIWLEEAQTLQIYVAYTAGRRLEEMAVYMTILVDRMNEYGPWAVRVELLLLPRVVHYWESPSIYTQHVCEMKSLVDKINRSFKVLSRVNVQVNLDYANFHQMKLAAAVFSLDVQWTLNYYIEGTLHLHKIETESHLMRRLLGVYERDFEV
ncbi:hypothetical protein DID88_006693 [Monilinia fructigena]|uniref:Uncharacterized protein n=1 Tax=Monilinia fructigena TaxID=38457 RepID=A0A395IFI4_9HELO|nr:hypothetical protein DID88_006693 [Monilinia fructigena]